jgi:hypothetical protein
MLVRLVTRGMTREGARWARDNLMTEALYVISGAKCADQGDSAKDGLHRTKDNLPSVKGRPGPRMVYRADSDAETWR